MWVPWGSMEKLEIKVQIKLTCEKNGKEINALFLNHYRLYPILYCDIASSLSFNCSKIYNIGNQSVVALLKKSSLAMGLKLFLFPYDTQSIVLILLTTLFCWTYWK